jgi:hypothetical protein
VAVDWNRARATVKRNVDKYGRLITLVNDSNEPVDATKPLGPRKPRLEVPDIKAVLVRPSGYIKLGESFYLDPGMFEEAEKIALVLPSLTYDFAKFTRIVDNDDSEYKIFKVEELKPGDMPLLLYLGLRQ